MSSFRYQPGTGETRAGPLPQQAPDLDIQGTDSGWSFYATPILGAAPSSTFFLRVGFEMGFVFASEHTSAFEWAEFDRRVRDHDKPEIHELVVTIGGPDRSGNIHPSEEVVFDLMLSDPRPTYEPEHLRRVLVHGWELGRIIQVHPELDVIAPGHFQGTMASHQLLRGN